MRISDWSSDVCSSDLYMHHAVSPDHRSSFDEAHGRRHMITRQNWSQWSALLDEALDLEGDARAQWLRELRLRRPDAAEALTRLLERDDPLIAGRHYERSLHAALTADDDNADAAKPGQSFGPWQVSRKLGSGGMGEVWLATRADRLYQGQAAIKLPANGGDTRRLGARFARDRNPLADRKAGLWGKGG